MFVKINEHYSESLPRSYYIACPPSDMQTINDTRIRFELNEIVFIESTQFNSSFSSTAGGVINDYVYENYPSTRNAMNYIFTHPEVPNGTYSWGYYSRSSIGGPFCHTHDSMWSPYLVVWGDHIGHVVHELGHALGLKHTYPFLQQGEITDITDFDFLDDVFGLCPEPSMMNASDPCFDNCGSSNEPCPCTPNVDEICLFEFECFLIHEVEPYPFMGAAGKTRYISAKQTGRMHRDLSLYDNEFAIGNRRMHENVKEITPSSVPYEITSNETWDFKIKMYQNIIIKSGNVLTITCEVMMPNEGKIIVEPGAKLIIDGGKVTNFYYLPDDKIDLWQGIEVWGNPQLQQNNSNQGVVEVINDGTIEFAKNGIRTIRRNNSGGLDWSKTGGIVRVNGGVFKDCRRGIEFMSYQNIGPNGNELMNKSFISNATFVTTDDKLSVPYAGISLHDITGVRIRNTVFENLQSDIETIDIAERGNGIISIDANYRAISSYSFSTGEPIAGTGNEFKNLFYGVLAYGGSGRSDLIINDNTFEECIYGVGLMGSNYGVIGRNTFELPSFNNNTSLGFGVFTDAAYGFNIEGNNFLNSSLSALNHHATNVRNSSTNTSSGKVYRNTVNNVYIGTQTIGDNEALKVDCNTYNKGKFSSVDVHHANGDLSDQGNCLTIPVNNMFDGPCNNNTLAQIFKNPVATDFLYNHQINTLNLSCHNIGVNAELCNDSDPNQCPDELANDVLVVKPVRIVNWKSKLNTTKEELGNVRDVLASGDTEELITSIENDGSGDTKDALLAASPYLSDRVLLAYLTKSPAPPPGHIKQVLLANSPLTDTVMAIVNNLSLPNGIRNQINSAQDGISERRTTEGTVSVLNTNRLIYVDAIVQEYLDTNWIDSAAIFLEQEGSLEALCALVPIEVRRGDTTRANTLIDTLRSVANDMEDNNPTCRMACELNEFCDFQQAVFRIALREGGYFSISPEERTTLEFMANSDARIAVNAKAILHFLDETLPEYEGEELVFPKSMESNEEVEELVNSSDNDLFTIHPNPSSGAVVFTVDREEINGLEIIITDLQGKVMKIINVNGHEVNDNLGAISDGVYLVHLVENGKIQSTKKLIYAK